MAEGVDRAAGEMAAVGGAAPGEVASARSSAITSTTQANAVIASATYVAGSTTLEPGRRYGFSVDATRLRILGPLDADPTATALDLRIRDMDASVMAGRLLLSQPASPSGSILAFMQVAGMTSDELAAAIVAAVHAARSG